MRKLSIGIAVVVASLWAAGAFGQTAIDATNISTDRAAVIAEMVPKPPTYSINSAIVLTNPHGRPSDFKIELFDDKGRSAGGGSVTVAPRGMEVIWVSKLLDDQTRRFVGWGVAKSERPLQCNAFLAGGGFSPLPVKNHRVRNTDLSSRRKLFSVLAAL